MSVTLEISAAMITCKRPKGDWVCQKPVVNGGWTSSSLRIDMELMLIEMERDMVFMAVATDKVSMVL